MRAGTDLPRRDETAGRLRGAAETLSVLKNRGPAEQRRASRYAVALLIREVTPEDWTSAGLPRPGGPSPRPMPSVPVSHHSVLRLAQAAMQLHCAGLRLAERPQRWARLVNFFARRVPAADPQLGRLTEHALNARVDAGDLSSEVVDGLAAAVERHRAADGEDAYLTGLARANLAIAYRQRGTGTDLAKSAALIMAEALARSVRYGPTHPVTLVARSLWTRSLLAQADTTQDQVTRLDLARQALQEIDEVRAARDRLFGVTSRMATRSRRYEGHALLLLGQFERAAACLEYTLAFETARNDNKEWGGSGETHLLLARVYVALANLEEAEEHARDAYRLMSDPIPRISR